MDKNIKVFSISDVADILEGTSLSIEDYLNNFTIEINPKIQGFFRDSALAHNKEHICRTFLVVDSETEFSNNIIGYFSLTITYRELQDGISQSIKKKISSNAFKHGIFPAVLISKLGRSDKYKKIVPGSKIMELALDKCYEIFELTGLRHVCVDYYDNDKLEKFYINDNGFKKYQRNEENNLNYCFYKFISRKVKL